MIRLVALACGLLCGAGFVLSGLHDPALLTAMLAPQETWNAALGFGLLVALAVAGLVAALPADRAAPLPGGQMEPVPGGPGWKPLASGMAFGIGWGISGYLPLTGMVSAGMLSSGAPVFLMSVLAGMILTDLLTGGRWLKRGGRGSFG